PLISKTGAILGLNIVLTVATVSTFLGTFYPMLFQAMSWGSISVGAPYFNSIFLPLLTLVLFAMAGTLCLGWFKANKKRFFKRLLLIIPAAVIAYGMIWNALQTDGALRFHF
ncbi:cytochrome c-type biogenesis CcmF C-terminal domain-containing protein, partial [Klebsiella aerogenes]|uniref:cytochrome c-type biogenesis CcmF C-terminal domain-containing protein n=1 Tax=Klebsiella aerogenes TaxID=548 RepID=UPI00254C2605